MKNRVLIAGTLIFTSVLLATNSSPSGSANSASPAATSVSGLLELGRPIILGHAAGENVAPHSTVYGFTESVKAGVDVIDLDLQRTKDNVLVVQHDDTVDRTTQTTGKVADLTYAQIHKLDNSYWFSSKCAGTCTDQPEGSYDFRGVRTGDKKPPKGYSAEDFSVVKFSDVAQRWPKYVLNIEIKGTAPDALITAKLLSQEIKKLKRTSSTVVTSFDDTVVDAFHKLQPTVAMSPGLKVMTAYFLENKPISKWERILQVPPVYEGTTVFNADFAARTKADGLLNWVWPNGEGEDVAGYLALLQQGANGINASNPAAGVAALKEFLAQK